MNILHVHSGNMFGGVERMLETLAPATAGRVPIASSFALCFEGLVSDTLRSAGADVHHLGAVHARRIDEIRQARRTLRGLLAARQWDVALVHSAWSQAIFGPVILQSGTPMVRWMHAPEPGPRWLEYWASRARPSLVLCNSRYTMESAERPLRSTPSVVCYPPAQRLDPDEHARRDVRRLLATPVAAVVVIVAARLESWKGHEVLLDGLAALGTEAVETWVVGGPQRLSEQRYFDALANRARDLGLTTRVRFLGQRSDVHRLMQAADIYCQPNVGAEPFGLSFVEALAAGLPVITTRLGAAPEIVDHTCGALVEHGSVPALTEALRGLIERPDARQQMSAAARMRAERFCDLPRSLETLAAALGRAATRSLALT